MALSSNRLPWAIHLGSPSIEGWPFELHRGIYFIEVYLRSAFKGAPSLCLSSSSMPIKQDFSSFFSVFLHFSLPDSPFLILVSVWPSILCSHFNWCPRLTTTATKMIIDKYANHAMAKWSGAKRKEASKELRFPFSLFLFF